MNLIVSIQTNYVQYKTQFLAAVVACLSGLSMSAVIGYMSPAMEEIKQEYALNDQELSLVTSISFFGSIIGCVVSGAISDRFGRKLGLIVAATICVLGWLVFLCAKFVTILYIARVVSGFSVAVFSTIAPVYVTEIASTQIRGALGSCFVLFTGIGILYVNVIGAFVSWRYLALACMAVPAIQSVLMLLLPETPMWLMRHNYEDSATDALNWLNRSDEFSELTNNQNTTTDRMTLKTLLEPALKKPLAIMGMLMLLTQFSGVGIISLYSVSIFSSATDAIDPNLSAILVSISSLISYVFAFFLVDRVGRRVLLLASGTFMAVGMFSMGAYYYLRDNLSSVSGSITWLPVTSLVIFVVSFSMGFGPIPWLMMGELFPNRARSMASSIITTVNWTLSLVVAKTYIDMKTAMHDYGVFWFYGAAMVFAVFFTYFCVPETKGMTLDEIEDHFKGRNELQELPHVSS